MKNQLLQRSESERIYQHSCGVIPGGVNSPVRAFRALGQTPLVAHSASGDTVIDVDGNTFIDYCGSWGALIHGHAHPRILEAAQKRMALGTSFGITTPIEARLAELVVELVPGIEKIRFVSSGTEATMSAVRVARGYTSRDLIVKFSGNYHGHSDAFLVQAGSGVMGLTPTSSSKGVPHDCVKHTLCLPYNDVDACRSLLRERGKEVAAVILEPIAANMGLVESTPEFIQMLREETTGCGALLIFDEVISGFRVALGGAAEYFGVTADLSCFGKILGGGFPAAAFGGKAEIMDVLAPLGPVYQAGTLSGNPVAMEAGYQSVSLCTAPDFYPFLQAKTDLITQPIREAIESKGWNLCLHQLGSLFTLFFGVRQVEHFEHALQCDSQRFNQFFKSLFEKGIYISPAQQEANFVSMAHTTEHLVYTRDCILETLFSIM